MASTDRDSTGFSRDVCAVLLIANITRCFFWLGNRFELGELVWFGFKLCWLTGWCSIVIPVNSNDPSSTGASVHMHSIQTVDFSGCVWLKVVAALCVLAMAALCPGESPPAGPCTPLVTSRDLVYRIPRRPDVGILCGARTWTEPALESC
jgi:hypothetical protein